MTVHSVGKATITRIEETFLPTYSPKDLFPEWTDAIHARHAHWLAPNHYDVASGLLKLSVHSWLLQIGGRKILIDSCCGNNKVKPGRPFWTNLNTNYLDRLSAAGRHRHGDVHPPAPRPRRLEYPTARRPLGADLSEGALRVLTARLRVFPEARYRSEDRACRDGHVPRMRAADRGRGARRAGHRAASSRRAYRDRAGPRPFGRPCGVLAGKRRRARRLHRRRVPSPAAGLPPGMEFPQELGRRSGARQPPHGARALRRDRRADLAGPCRGAVRRPHRGGGGGIRAAVRVRKQLRRRAAPAAGQIIFSRLITACAVGAAI